MSYPGSPWMWGITYQPRFAEQLTEALLDLDPNQEPKRKICIFVDDDDDGLQEPSLPLSVTWNAQCNKKREGTVEDSQKAADATLTACGFQIARTSPPTTLENITPVEPISTVSSTTHEVSNGEQSKHEENGWCKGSSTDERMTFEDEAPRATKRSQHHPERRRYLQEIDSNQRRALMDVNESDGCEEWIQRRKAFRALRDY